VSPLGLGPCRHRHHVLSLQDDHWPARRYAPTIYFRKDIREETFCGSAKSGYPGPEVYRAIHSAPMANAAQNNQASYWRSDLAYQRSVLMPSEMKRLKLLEEENSRLKRLVADLSLEKAMLQDVVKRNIWSAPPLQGL
jgi:putative transposase